MGLLYDKWVKQGLIPDAFFRPTVIETKNLPMKCQLDVANLLKRPVEQRIKEANRQIKQTKEYFDLPEAKGLLLLVNDGNYSLESNAVMYLVSRCIKTQFTAIHTVIYFTVNLLADMPGVDRDVLIWLNAPRVPGEVMPREFLDTLRDGFHSLSGRREKIFRSSIRLMTI